MPRVFYALSVKGQLNSNQKDTSILAVVNPTNDLSSANFEGEAIAKLFHTDAQKILIGNKATKETVLEEASKYTYLHFACHGSYSWQEVMLSGLKLANDEFLNLSEIITKLDLKSTRLITLSACETGLIEIQDLADEYIGLSSGFLQAGVPGVVCTLWEVDDLPTTLLMSKFYELHLKGSNVAQALHYAQKWIRNIKIKELYEYFQSDGDIIHQIQQRFGLNDEEDLAFDSPYYWASFVLVGI